ncbi:ATOH8 protein, partial [Spelaeornis formosus]|nr:ATOH8 protein [Elachura formosa]
VPSFLFFSFLFFSFILRIACNYILSLARLADLDYSADHSNMSFLFFSFLFFSFLLAEGRSKKRTF